jgi:hypothetical protein
LQEGSDQQQQLAVGALVQKQRLKFTKFSNAYMLVYVRLSDWQCYMGTVTKDGIAPYLLERLEVRRPALCISEIYSIHDGLNCFTSAQLHLDMDQWR